MARLRLPRLSDAQENLDLDAVANAVMSEVQTMIALAKNTRISVPKVHTFNARADCEVGAPFILMDCLEGNVGTDLSMVIPTEHKQHFFEEVAKIQVSVHGELVSLAELIRSGIRSVSLSYSCRRLGRS